jgi:hypothetical protein
VSVAANLNRPDNFVGAFVWIDQDRYLLREFLGRTSRSGLVGPHIQNSALTFMHPRLQCSVPVTKAKKGSSPRGGEG